MVKFENKHTCSEAISNHIKLYVCHVAFYVLSISFSLNAVDSIRKQRTK